MNSRVERFMKIQRFLKLSQFEDSSGNEIDADAAGEEERQSELAMISIGLINALSSIIPFIRDKMPGSIKRPESIGGEAYAYRKILYFLKNIDKSIIRDIAKDPTDAPQSIPERAELMNMSRVQLNALARRVGVNTGEAKKKIYFVAAIDRARSNLPPIPMRDELEEMKKSDGEGGEADLFAAENALLALAEAHVEKAIPPAESKKHQKRLLVLAEKNEMIKAARAARADEKRVRRALDPDAAEFDKAAAAASGVADDPRADSTPGYKKSVKLAAMEERGEAMERARLERVQGFLADLKHVRDTAAASGAAPGCRRRRRAAAAASGVAARVPPPTTRRARADAAAGVAAPR